MGDIVEQDYCIFMSGGNYVNIILGHILLRSVRSDNLHDTS